MTLPITRNLDLDLQNTTSNNIDCRFLNHFRQSFIPREDVDRYSMAITRFEIPLTSLQKHIISDTSKYTITLESYGVSTATNEAELIDGSANMYDNSIYPIYNVEDYIENMNLNLINAWRNLIDHFGSTYTDTASLNNQAFQSAGSLTANLGITNSGSLETASVYLTISDWQQVAASGNEDDYVDIILTNPAGTVVQVASSVLIVGTVNFYDGAPKLLSHLPQNREISGDYNPLESFLKMKDDAGTGTFVITIRPSFNNSLDVTCDVSLTVQTPPSVSNRFTFPNVAPNYTWNSNTGVISLLLHEKFIQSGLRIRLDSKPLQVFQIASKNIGDYVLIPETTLSSTLDKVLTFEAEIPRVAYINQMYKLLINTNSFNIIKDSNNNDNRSNAITSYLIPSEDIFRLDYVRFVQESFPWRRYSIKDSDIQNFDFNVFVEYQDGNLYQVQLQPNEFANLLVSFFREN